MFAGVLLIAAVKLRTLTYSTNQTNLSSKMLPPGGSADASPVFLIVICKSPSNSIDSSFSRQKRQLAVLFKSAATLSSRTLRFVVMTDSEEVFEQVQEIPAKWPEHYRSRLVFERRIVWYPSDRQDMKMLLRPCSSARLFIPETITDLDAAVLVDTDTIFLRSPEKLFEELYKFDDKQAAGLAQTSQGYGGRKIPYPGSRGVNTGVMVLNLTRLRAMPGGWTDTNLNVFDRYRGKIQVTATNDILNILFGENPELLYDLSCPWNYSPGACWKGFNTCKEADVNGVSLVHGTSAAFVKGRNPKFKAVFEAWEEYEIGDPSESLLQSIERRIQADKSPIVRCNKVSNLNFLFTEALRRVS